MATTIGNPAWIQALTYAASDDRQVLRALTSSQGVAHPTDMATTQNGSPNMSVNVSSGQAFVLRTASSPPDFYCVESPNATTNLTIATSDPTNPRIDIVVVTINDAQYAGGTNSGVLQVVTGTPAGSPVAPSTPNNSLLLAQIAVAANATSIVNANITDKRVNALESAFLANKRVAWGYTSNSTWTKPTAPNFLGVWTIGTGGGGGGGGVGAASASQGCAAAGGGAGNTLFAWIPAGSLSSTETVTIGAAGAAGPNNGGSSAANSGGNGGATTFGSHWTANGGNGGSGDTTGANFGGHQGGAASGGAGGTFDLSISGGNGENGWKLASGAGAVGGHGAASFWGDGGVGELFNVSGCTAGVAYGSGGGGACAGSSGAALAGQAGAAGVCYVLEIYG